MKKILVPIDFKECTLTALHFAKRIAEDLSASLMIVHIDDGSFVNREVWTDNKAENRVAMIQDRMAFLFSASYDDGAGLDHLNIEYRVLSGSNPSRLIKDLSEDFDLIIMGMVNAYLIDKRMFGGHASKVAQQASCPVLLVPLNAAYDGFQRIVYGTNWESMAPKALHEAADWADLFGSRIDFLHVDESYEFKEFSDTDRGKIMEIMDQMASNAAYNIVEVKDISPLREIRHYADQEKASLIIIANRKRDFLTNMLAKSLTKELALHTHVPILVVQIHSEDYQ